MLDNTVGSVSTPLNADAIFESGEQASVGDTCTSDDGYDDVAEGAQVVVSNQSGEIIYTTELQAGTLVAGPEATIFDARCRFEFKLDGVPLDSDFYGIHVGNTNRGEVVFDADELAAGPELSLGN